MSARPEQPEPFIRGCLYPGLSGVAYPRANPAESEHVPSDVWQAAQIPAGVRLEIVGEAQAVRIFYQTTTANFGYRGEGAGCTFSIYRSGQKIAEEEAVLGNGVVQLPLTGEPSRPAVIYLPEGMRPIIRGVEAVGGAIEPAPRQPRWLCFGDATTQGWLASSPALAWPAVNARKLGLDLCNLGYAGSVRTDPAAGIGLADTPAELITISLGVNAWGRFPHTPAMCAEEVRGLISLVRSGHRDSPIVVLSPLLRPDAEDTANRLGATLTELRIAMEEAVRERMIAGDVRLHLVEGSTIVSQSDLADGIYPGDDGHIRIAAAVGKVISPLVAELRDRAEARWAAEAAASASLQIDISQLPSTDFLRQVGTGAAALGPLPAISSAPAGVTVPAPPPSVANPVAPPAAVAAVAAPAQVNAPASVPAAAQHVQPVSAEHMPRPVPAGIPSVAAATSGVGSYHAPSYQPPSHLAHPPTPQPPAHGPTQQQYQGSAPAGLSFPQPSALAQPPVAAPNPVPSSAPPGIRPPMPYSPPASPASGSSPSVLSLQPVPGTPAVPSGPSGSSGPAGSSQPGGPTAPAASSASNSLADQLNMAAAQAAEVSIHLQHVEHDLPEPSEDVRSDTNEPEPQSDQESVPADPIASAESPLASYTRSPFDAGAGESEGFFMSQPHGVVPQLSNLNMAEEDSPPASGPQYSAMQPDMYLEHQDGGYPELSQQTHEMAYNDVRSSYEEDRETNDYSHEQDQGSSREGL